MTTRFIGLDLAWSPANNTAGVALEAEQGLAKWAEHREQLGDDDQVLAFIHEAAAGHPAFVAIDAPLIVPNETGARPVDREITRPFGRYDAGCYPANRLRGCARGEDIVAALANSGFQHNPYVSHRAAARCVFEVYPHPAMVALFNLDKTLKYRAGRRRSMAFQRRELSRLRSHLLGLHHGGPAMTISCKVVNCDTCTLRGRAFKRYEDLLDAAMCAYIAYFAWYWGPESYDVYGDTSQGYILVPITKQMRTRLAPHLG